MIYYVQVTVQFTYTKVKKLKLTSVPTIDACIGISSFFQLYESVWSGQHIWNVSTNVEVVAFFVAVSAYAGGIYVSFVFVSFVFVFAAVSNVASSEFAFFVHAVLLWEKKQNGLNIAG